MRTDISGSQTVKLLKAAPVALALMAAPALLSACSSSSEVLSHGYQVDECTLALVPEGSSREQVLLSLGTPSTIFINPERSLSGNCNNSNKKAVRCCN